jgi:transposase
VQDSRVWRQMLGLGDATVIEKIVFDAEGAVVARVRPRRGTPMRCGRCGRPAPRYDRGEGLRRWRSLDVGPLQAFIEARSPRVNCPEHGPTVVAVPWARHGARHSHQFDQTVTWLARYCAKQIVAFLFRVAWETVGSIITRVMSDVDALGADRFDNVRRIGIDEVSYQKGHKYLVVVVNHANGQLLWVGKGRTKKTLGEFFTALGEERCQRIALVSADGADWIADMVGLNCPNAELCLDPFHAVSWVTEALDKVRRRMVGEARRTKNATMLDTLNHARWAVLKNPDRLTKPQQLKLANIQQVNHQLYRAYLLKEQFRAIFAPGGEERILTLDEWLIWASRSRIPEFVDVARKVRPYRDDIASTLTHGLTNALVEGLNARVRLLINIARGFRSVEALMALMQLHLGAYQPTLPGRPQSAPTRRPAKRATTTPSWLAA